VADLFGIVDRMIGVDAAGRLAGAGPHFHVFRTAEQAVGRRHTHLSDRVRAELDRLAARPRGRPSAWAEEYADCLRVLATVAPLKAVRAGPLFTIGSRPEGGETAVQITPDNAGLLRGGLDEWLPDVAAGVLMFAVLADGKAAAVCASVKAWEAAHVAGVETAPSQRGRGLASRAVAAWAREVLRLGATPVYGTTFDNLASQGVARRLGMTLVGSEFSVTLDL
jgi:GNAT superfamily N-acetyltransferase